MERYFGNGETNSFVATIGQSISIKGEVTGSEDLIVHGRVEGAIRLPGNTVTVAGEGRVQADIEALVIRVEGEVSGNLSATELIHLERASYVKGDVTAPRVCIQEGAKLRGLVNTETDDARDITTERTNDYVPSYR
jgi:cytoskeletal protein CcmA (bactofilin family)